jgi:hypothetical protein
VYVLKVVTAFLSVKIMNTTCTESLIYDMEGWSPYLYISDQQCKTETYLIYYKIGIKTILIFVHIIKNILKQLLSSTTVLMFGVIQYIFLTNNVLLP